MQSTVLTFSKISPTCDGTIAVLKINRPEAANAFNAEIMRGLSIHATEVNATPNVRALVLTGAGKHFSAGADLNWMKESAKLSKEQNIADSQELTKMFEAFNSLSIPTIAVVKGAAYGGAVGLAAICDITIATDTARFCLSEVRLGLLPAVISPYLARKMTPGPLRHLALTAKVFDAQEAKEAGLVQIVCSQDNLNASLKDTLNQLLTAGPKAIGCLKQLLDDVRNHKQEQGLFTAQAIAAARAGEEGQSGLNAFFSKAKPSWFAELEQDWTWDEH